MNPRSATQDVRVSLDCQYPTIIGDYQDILITKDSKNTLEKHSTRTTFPRPSYILQRTTTIFANSARLPYISHDHVRNTRFIECAIAQLGAMNDRPRMRHLWTKVCAAFTGQRLTFQPVLRFSPVVSRQFSSTIDHLRHTNYPEQCNGVFEIGEWRSDTSEGLC
jgi:hypothetical protein